jgi:hypothetical protein
MVITLSNHDIHIIRILACVSGSLSSFGAAMLFLSFFLFTELRTYSSRLILCLSISDLGTLSSFFPLPSFPMLSSLSRIFIHCHSHHLLFISRFHFFTLLVGEAISWALGPASEGHFACYLQVLTPLALPLSFHFLLSSLSEYRLLVYNFLVFPLCCGKCALPRVSSVLSVSLFSSFLIQLYLLCLRFALFIHFTK